MRLILAALMLAACATPQAEPVAEVPPAQSETAASVESTVPEPVSEDVWQEGEEKDPIEIKFEACQEEDSSTYGMNMCISAAIEDWDAELNRVYGAIMETADEEMAGVVRSAQRDWITYRDADLEVIRTLYGRLEGTYWSIELGIRRMGTLQNQVEQLRWYLIMLS